MCGRGVGLVVMVCGRCWFGVFVSSGAVCYLLFWMSAFVGHVLHVVCVCACEEVVGVDAFFVVAGVADHEAWGDGAFGDGVGVAVCEPCLFVDL